MFKNLLIANRGEIACRIIKTAKKLGIKTTAVYSDADTNSLHVRMADKAIYIGESSATQSYLNSKKLLNAVKISGADALHPGYGFLSENPDFVELLEKNGITFVGPSAQAVKSMGDKIEAKKIAQRAGVNVVPGYLTAIKDVKDAIKIASKIGFPIMLKAAAGGGGKGMRIVRSKEEMQQAFSSTRNEARNNFSDERTFIEKFIENPRHIEIQLIGDKYGNYVCLGERECSIQRHNQKVIEEAPSSFIDEKTRKKMYEQSIALAKKVKYFSAGTIEFIVDKDKRFYFLEMNTRLQVEHPVTELITGYDIVELMLRVAAGEKLPITQKDVKINGWAFESRIYAEDPSSGFIPSTGQIITYKEPEKSESIRIDSGIYEGGEVSMFYDPIIAKLCSYGPTRKEAIEAMKSALGKFVIRGISHNISFLQAIFSHPKFESGDITTNFIAQEYEGGFTGATLSDEETAVMLVASAHIFLSGLKRDAQINGQLRGFSRNFGTRWVVRLDDQNFPITARSIDDGYKVNFGNRRFYITSYWMLGSKLFDCNVNGRDYSLQLESRANGYAITFRGRTVHSSFFSPRAAELIKFVKTRSSDSDVTELAVNISGRVVDIKVNPGDQVTKGQPLVILEAMKMENILTSPRDGIVEKILHKIGDNVSTGEVIMNFQ
ncbi:MAG: Acetyl-CoA carboxylase, biotin carboxylase [Candidatus Midichloriaceae bacterium]|jgi:propionyl-CoA carboxylase alpha chain|nr:Acetyl-CoA carboxylase, biotin carboxylase [Candidatus Midichloriaceae bacterium]